MTVAEEASRWKGIVRAAGLVLGILGGAWGMFWAAVIALGAMGVSFSLAYAPFHALEFFGALAAVFISFAGVVGTVLAEKFPRLGTFLMFLCGVAWILALAPAIRLGLIRSGPDPILCVLLGGGPFLIVASICIRLSQPSEPSSDGLERDTN